MFSYSN